MSELLNLILFALWFIIITIDTLGITHYWQRKEYRLDRMRDFWQYDDAIKIATKPTNLIIYTLLIATTLKPEVLSYTLLIIVLIKFWQISQKGLLRPKSTTKAKAIIISHITLNTILFIAGLYFQKHWLIPLSLLITSINTSLIIGLLNIPTQFAKRFYIITAHRKIKSIPNLITIGITGSYGKSSTKEMLAQILEQHQSTIKTPANINTEIGVAQLIIRQVSSAYKYFVCEMGAYRKNDIGILARMTQPQIGIITAVAPQHLSLFGSIDAIRKTKGELAHNLKKNGTAILNGDNEHCRKIASELPTTTRVLYYSTEPKSEADCKLINKKESNNIYDLEIIIKINNQDKEFPIVANLPAPHFIGNLLAAILAAYTAGMEIPEIQEAITKISLPSIGFEKYQTTNNINVIDDSYNANPDGLKAAISTLTTTQGNKYIVTMGMAELGQLARAEHIEIAKLIIANNIHCFVTKQTTYNYFTEAAILDKKDPNLHFTYIDNLNETAKIVLNKLTAGDTLLLANRVPQNLKQALKPKQ